MSKKSPSTTALAVVSKTPVIVPKATKAEIVAAMVSRAHSLFVKEQTGMIARRDELEASLKKRLLAHVIKNVKTLEPSITVYHYEGYRDEVEFGISPSDISEDYAKDHIQYTRCREAARHTFDEAATKRRILDHLDNREDRVHTILSVPENVAVIDELLAKVNA